MFVRTREGAKSGKALSPQYRAWKQAAAGIVKAAWINQDRPTIDKPYRAHIRINIDHKGDIANREKALTDILVATIPGFPDDCWINRIVIERDRTVDGAVITVSAMDAP